MIRGTYKDVAKRVANLYFVILDLAMIEPTYQWSLEFYIALFEKSVRDAIHGKENRNKNIIDKFQQLLFEGTCRSLLEKDKLIFSFLMCLKIMSSEEKVSSTEIRFTMVGGTYTSPNRDKPTMDWVSNKMWAIICEAVDHLQPFKDFDKSFFSNSAEWTKIYDSSEP